MKTPYPFLLALAVLAAGCQDAPLSDASQASPSPAFAAVAGGLQYALQPDVPQEDLLEAARVSMITSLDIAATADSWQDAHAAVGRAVASAETDLQKSAIEQATAKMMLEGYLIPNVGDPEVSRLGLAYAEQLVDRESPEASIVLAAVSAFRTEWPAEATAKVALGAAEVVDAHLAAIEPCDDCKTDEAWASREAAGQAPDVWAARQQVAASQLRAAIQ